MKVSNKFLHSIFVCLVLSWSTYVIAMQPDDEESRLVKYQLRKTMAIVNCNRVSVDPKCSLLALAIEYDKVDEMKALLDEGVDPDGSYGRSTMLCFAARKGSYNAAKLLLERGADVNKGSGSRQVMPLYEAAGKGNLELLKLLLQYKPDLDVQHQMFKGPGDTPLRAAVSHYSKDHPACLALLVAAGACTTLPTYSMPLHKAAHYGYVDCAQILLATPANSLLKSALPIICCLQLWFKRLRINGVAIPRDIQLYLCQTYLTQVQLDKANLLCVFVNDKNQTAYDIACARPRCSEVAQLTNPNDASVRRKVIWDTVGALMARTMQQEDGEHESE